MGKQKKQIVSQEKDKTKYFLIALAILIIPFTFKAIDGELLNFDDNRYISENPATEDLSMGGVVTMFTSYFDGHYHPITQLSLAIDKELSKDEVRMHHITNWLLHICNVLLVFLFLFALFKKEWLAFGVALFFGLHPMAVESFAWMSERKNVLYSFFFLLSCLTYLKYLEKSELKILGLCFFLAVLSILSKAQGIILLPTFLLIDLLKKRNLKEKQMYLEKIPLLVGILAMVIFTSSAQAAAWDVSEQYSPGLGEKLILASVGFFKYSIFSFIPYALSPYYPYPHDAGVELGILHFMAPLFFIAFLVALYFSFKKEDKTLFFGLSFFLINIFLLLKFLEVPFGDYLMADRYNYLPLIGLMTVAVWGMLALAEKIKRIKYAKVGLIGIVGIGFGILTIFQIRIWHDSVSLWTKVIDNYPEYADAYNMRSMGYMIIGKNIAAEKDLTKLVELKPNSVEGFLNLSSLQIALKNWESAEKFIEQAKLTEDATAAVYATAANIYFHNGRFTDAGIEIDQALTMERTNKDYLVMKAKIQANIGDTESAKSLLRGITDHEGAKKLLAELEGNDRIIENTTKNKAYNQLIDQGIEFGNQNQLDLAEGAFSQAIALDPQNYLGYLNRGTNLAMQGHFQVGLADLLKAISIAPNEGRPYFILGSIYQDLGNRVEACKNYRIADSKGVLVPPNARAYCM